MRFKGYIFDLDGTIYLGEALLPKAKETILKLRNSGGRVLFLSNKPTESRHAFADKLSRLGIETAKDEEATTNSAQHPHQQNPAVADRHLVTPQPS